MARRNPGGGPVVVAAEARRLAVAWARQLEELAGEMFDYLAARIAELKEDEATSALTLASCASNLESLLSMIRHGIPADRTEAPVAALEHARHMAAQGASIDATLRFYRLGHAWFAERWNAALVERIADRTQLIDALRESAAFSFTYIDVVAAKVSAEHVAERDRRQRRAVAVHADVVRALLAGESVNTERVELVLGFALERPLLAFLCWTTGDLAELEQAAGALSGAIGRPRQVVLADGPRGIAGWMHVARREPSAAAVAKAIATAAPAVHVAVGSVGTGVEGFRRSREQAERARRVAQLTQRPSPSFTRFEDVALVDLLSRDLPAAQAFVRDELGALAERGERPAVLRTAMLAYLSAYGSHAAAAARLGVHRNTALQRLRRAEELRGRPAAQHGHELLAALLLAATLGDAVLVDR